jgi:type II secretory pathway pseudopilin PulG
MRSRLNPRRGFTAFELGLVAGLLGIVGLGAFLVFTPVASARVGDAALQNAQTIQNAASDWRQDNPNGCPTISTLLEAKKLSPDAATEDPWGQRYRLVCEGEAIIVTSPGADGKRGTGDDVRVPRSS